MYKDMYEHYVTDAHTEGSGDKQKVVGRCPIHGDETSESFAAFTHSGKAACFGACQFQGLDPVAFLCKINDYDEAQAKEELKERWSITTAKRGPGRPPKQERKLVPVEEIEFAHENLLRNKQVLKELQDSRGWSDDIIHEFKIGYEPKQDRIWIPIKEGGEYVDIKQYDWRHKTDKKFLSYGSGYGGKRLFPEGRGSSVLLIEGEPDCLLARTWGLDARTFTNGAGAVGALSADRVTILYDDDKAGHSGAKKAGAILRRTCGEVRVIALPSWEGKPAKADLTDWWRSGATKESLSAIIDEAWGTNKNLPLVSLAEALDQRNYNETLRVKCVPTGKDITPYQVPAKSTITCTHNLTICSRCPLRDTIVDHGEHTFSIPRDSSILIECSGEDNAKVRRTLTDHLGIPKTCNAHEIIHEEMVNLYDIRLTSEVDMEQDEAEYIAVRVWSVVPLELNQPVIITARVIPDPKNQYATLIITEAQSDKTALDDFQLSEADLQKLKEVFQP